VPFNIKRVARSLFVLCGVWGLMAFQGCSGPFYGVPPEASVGEASTSDASDGSAGDGSAGDARDDQSCLGQETRELVCASFIGANCGGSEDGLRTCDYLAGHFVNGVSRDIMECIRSLPTCTSGVEECLLKALGRACVVPSAVEPCAKASAFCATQGVQPEIDPGTCRRYHSALAPGGQRAFESCASTTCGLRKGLGCFLD
jgi:hypothetical protein